MTNFISLLVKTPTMQLFNLYKKVTTDHHKFMCLEQLLGAYESRQSEIDSKSIPFVKGLFDLTDLNLGMPPPAKVFKPFRDHLIIYTDDVLLNGYEGSLEDHPAYNDIMAAREAILQHKKDNPDFYKPFDPIGM